jgi:hypothetical protein
MSKEKKVLIIVHGAWMVKFHLRIIEFFKDKLLKLTNAGRGIIKSDYHNFKRYMEKGYDKIETLKWSGGILKKQDIKPAITHLSRLLNKNKKEKVDIIAFSLGGLITQLALNQNKNIPINKIIFAGSIHDPKIKILNSNKIINVYSKRDKFLEIAEYLYTKATNENLKWKNTFNIEIKDLIHDNLCQNKTILLNGKKMHLFDYYKQLLLTSPHQELPNYS